MVFMDTSSIGFSWTFLDFTGIGLVFMDLELVLTEIEFWFFSMELDWFFKRI